MPRHLDSQELPFHSFKHSQGRIDPQLHIFRYMDLKFGISADLHPGPEAWQRLTGYLSGVHANDATQHLQLDDFERSGAEREVYKAIKAIRKDHNSRYGRAIRRKDLTGTVASLAWGIVRAEVSILGYEKPWANYRDGRENNRPERQEARVKGGRASFLLYHGRDGHPTGFVEFDQMYQDMWALAAERNPNPWQKVMEEHNDAVAFAEANHLGELCLARESIVF